jgi:hypothetical protein
MSQNMTHELISHYYKAVLNEVPLNFFRELVKDRSSGGSTAASNSVQTFRNYIISLRHFSEQILTSNVIIFVMKCGW